MPRIEQSIIDTEDRALLWAVLSDAIDNQQLGESLALVSVLLGKNNLDDTDAFFVANHPPFVRPLLAVLCARTDEAAAGMLFRTMLPYPYVNDTKAPFPHPQTATRH